MMKTVQLLPRSKRSFLRDGLFLTSAICATAMTGLFVAPAAHAQEAAPAAPAMEEIVVTARQRAEKVLDIPISIQAFSEAQLETNKVTDLNSLQFQAGFTFQQATSTAAGGREFPALIFRGLQSTYGGGVGDSGAVFIDGIFLSAGLASVNLADAKDVIVLKGPQNVYFGGKNTFGGAIDIITASPKDTFAGSVDASVSMRGSSDVKAKVEGPLIKGILDGRLEVDSYDKAKQYTSADGGPLGAESTKGITGTLYATPSDGLWIRFRGHYQQDSDSAADTGFLPGSVYGSLCAPGVGQGTTSTGGSATVKIPSKYFCNGTIPSLAQTGVGVLNVNTVLPTPFVNALVANKFSNGPDPFLSQAPGLTSSGLRRNLTELSTQVGYDLPYDAKFNFNAGYNGNQSLDIWDLDRSLNQVFINAQDIVSRDLTLDARLTSDQSSKLRGVLGASYFNSVYKSSFDNNNYYNYPAIPFATPPGVQTSNYQNQHDEIWAIYGSIDYDIFDFLTLTGEARYKHDVVTDYTFGNNGVYHTSYNTILPRAILTYHPEPSWSFYVSWSEGTQPAQLQTSFINANAAQRAYLATAFTGVGPYTPLPKLYTWEIGAKQALFNNRIEYSIAAYDEKFDHQLTSAALFNPASCGGASLTPACPLSSGGIGALLSNNADIKGVEFNGEAKITDKWNLDLSVDYKHAVWLDYANSTLKTFAGGISNFNNSQIARVPSLQGTVSSTYNDHLVGNWDWYAHAQMIYTGGMYESEVNIARTNAYQRVNASLGVTRGNLTLELWVKNLFNDQNWDWASRVPELQDANALASGYTINGVLVQAPDKRDAGIRMKYTFDAGQEAPVTTAAYTPPPAQPVAPAKAPRSYLVFFDFNKSDLTSQAVSIVDTAAKNAGPAKVTQIEVTGHTDTVGSDAYNMRLSRRRAEAVAKQLEKDGIPSSEIAIFAKGKKDLLVPTADGVREPQNRRVQIMYEGGPNS
jgi:iron complex outermembrane receptor protein